MADLTYRSSSNISTILCIYILYGRSKEWKTIISQFPVIRIFSTANMTEGEDQFHVTLLVGLCDCIAPLYLISRTILEIQNISLLLSLQYDRS